MSKTPLSNNGRLKVKVYILFTVKTELLRRLSVKRGSPTLMRYSPEYSPTSRSLPSVRSISVTLYLAEGGVEPLHLQISLRPENLLLIARIEVESEDHGITVVLAYIHCGGMLTLVWRHEPVLVPLQYYRFQRVVVAYGAFAVISLLGRHVVKLDVEAELAHHGHVGAEFHRRGAVPRGDMGAERLGRENLREAPLDIQTLYRVGVVAGPELGEISQPLVVGAPPAAGAHHHQVGIFLLYPVEHVIQPLHVIHIQAALVQKMVKLLHAARCGRFWRQITNLWLIATSFVKNIKGSVFGI